MSINILFYNIKGPNNVQLFREANTKCKKQKHVQ